MQNSALRTIAKICFSAMFLCVPALAFAEDRSGSISVVNDWYAAIDDGQSADDMADAVVEIFAANGIVVLEDLGVTQTRDEFIESLDAWSEAIENGTVAHRIEDSSRPELVSALVCYDFGSSQLLNREVFMLSGVLIVKSVQSKVADDCSNF